MITSVGDTAVDVYCENEDDIILLLYSIEAPYTHSS